MNLKKLIVLIISSMALFTVMNMNSVSMTSNQSVYASTTYKSKLSKANQKAKNWIAYRESRGSYKARNGIYIGRYQLTASYLHGDFSKNNQEKTADRYVKNRYGSWVNAKKHWIYYGWY
ncbi:aggregation promoting factor surface protein [Lentilactobacillus laojiaonis]|nr:aggregation promoting factor surface protein [Lentilactobacillus laojiaonis]UDM32103.1 aggregation promoting factor surface protein [Lentilactobacillus laojiaonis]